jgi:hypothetical protein
VAVSTFTQPNRTVAKIESAPKKDAPKGGAK